MFIGDIIIATRAFRAVIRNCQFCLDIYQDFISQETNPTNSPIHLPTLCI